MDKGCKIFVKSFIRKTGREEDNVESMTRI
jgi:hypothetical protein